MATFVLVHGEYHGGWVYARVARLLREAGHEVYTPTLTGLGERSHLAHHAINLDTHIEDIVSVFKHEVCIPHDVARRTDMIPGATMRHPDALDRWSEDLPRDRPVAVYCFFGFQVRRNTVAELRRRGFNARSMKGGIGAWHAIGGATAPLDTSTYGAP